MGVFDRMAEHGHEQVVFCFDRQTGMRAIIAIHDTALGPARGGTRYKAYASEEEALEDALRLSKGMTYKFAFTDLPRGGGKAVLLKQEGTADKRVLLRSFGRFVQLLAGRFGTGPDLGTSAKEMVDIARETDFVWAIDQRFGGTGDSTPLTASGVYAGIGAALDEVYGTPDVAGRRVAIQGLGGVGGHLAELLVARGAVVTGSDIDPGRAKELADRLDITVEDPDALYDVDCDVFSPNAVGGVLNEHTIARLRCRIVAGGANNQLASADDGRRLLERGDPVRARLRHQLGRAVRGHRRRRAALLARAAGRVGAGGGRGAPAHLPPGPGRGGADRRGRRPDRRGADRLRGPPPRHDPGDRNGPRA